MALLVPQSLLLALTAFGYVSLHHFSDSNGFFASLQHEADKHSFAHRFSSVKAIDDLCNFFFAFFEPVVSGEHIGLAITGFAFAGQWLAGWMVVLMETRRVGNKGKLVSYASIFGLLYQSLGLGLCLPAWLFLHLMTSPIVNNPTSSALALESTDLDAIFVGLFLGFVLPSYQMARTDLSQDTQAFWIIFWQLFPVWTCVAIYAWTRLPGIATKSRSTTSQTQATTRTRPPSRIQFLRILVIAVSAVTHISACTLSIMAAVIPAMFNTTHAQGIAGSILQEPPWALDASVKVASIPQGVEWFLKYDFFCASLAFSVWGVSLKLAGMKNKSWANTGYECLLYVFKGLFLGQMAAVALLVLERDEEVLSTAEVEIKKKV